MSTEVIKEVEETKTDDPAKQEATPPAGEAKGSGEKGAETATTGKVYTEEDLSALREKWLKEDSEAKQKEEELKKLSPEQQAIARAEALEKEVADMKLTNYARTQMIAADIPENAISLVKGKDEADTDARIKAFGEILTAGIQMGVEKRFQEHGHTPKGNSAGKSEGNEKSRRSSGVQIVPGK